METNIVVDISPPVSYSSSQIRTANQISGFFKCNISTIRWMMKFFLHADNHESLVQVDTIILGEFDQACPKCSK